MYSTKELNNYKACLCSHKKEITELQNAYMALYALNECVKEQFEEADRKVLSEYAFFMEAEGRDGRPAGSRALTNSDAWRLSESDFDKYQVLCLTEYIKRGLTKDDGTYTEETDTNNQLLKLKDQIIDFSLELLPDGEEKKTLKRACSVGEGYNYKTWSSVFDLFMKLRAE